MGVDWAEVADRAVVAFLLVAVLEGAVLAGFLVWVGTGAFSSRNAALRQASERISELNGGRGISFVQSAAGIIGHSFSTLFRPVAGLRRADASWARDVQKRAKNALTAEDEVTLLAMLTSVSAGVGIAAEAVGDARSQDPAASSRRPSPSETRTRMQVLRERTREDLEDARNLSDVRSRLKAARWGLLVAGIRSLKEERHRAHWQRLGATCADYIGRGAAFNLVVTMLIARRVADIETLLSITSLLGGAIGAIAFAAMLLKKCQGATTPESSRFLSRLTQRPLVIALSAPTWTAGFTAGAYAFMQWLPTVLPV